MVTWLLFDAPLGYVLHIRYIGVESKSVNKQFIRPAANIAVDDK